MGKAAGVSRRRKKIASHKYSSSKKLKRTRQRELRKSGGGIDCDVVREAWSKQRSLRSNLNQMGLAHDPNHMFASETRQHTRQQFTQMRIESLGLKPKLSMAQQVAKKLQKRAEKRAKRAAATANDQTTSNDTKSTSVVEKLESQIATKSSTHSKAFRFGPEQVRFCAYMLEKYGDDYDAMVRDTRNRYQESAGQIRAKIRKFLSIPEHARVYERAKAMVEEQLANEEEKEEIDNDHQ